MGDDNSFVLRATKGLRWKLWTDLNPFSVAVFSFMYGFYFNQPVLDGRHNIQTGRDQKTHLLATVPSVLIWQKTPHDPQGAAAEKCHVISLESPVCLPVSPSVRPFSVLTDLTSTVNIKIHISSKKHYMVIHLFCVCLCMCVHACVNSRMHYVMPVCANVFVSCTHAHIKQKLVNLHITLVFNIQHF